jgi:hypothetical protein
MVHSERFELPALGIEIRCSIQLSYECNAGTIAAKTAKASPWVGVFNPSAAMALPKRRISDAKPAPRPLWYGSCIFYPG